MRTSSMTSIAVVALSCDLEPARPSLMRACRAAAGKWIWREAGGQIPSDGGYRRRYLGCLCRRRWPAPRSSSITAGDRRSQRRHCTWTDYKKAGPLPSHWSSEQGRRRAGAHFLFDVTVKVTGSENWINAHDIGGPVEG